MERVRMEKSAKTEKLFRFIEIKEKLEKGEILKKKNYLRNMGLAKRVFSVILIH